MAQSLDSVLADVDASEQEIATELPVEQTAEASQEVEATDEGDQGQDAHGALHAERQRVKRKYTETVADFDKRLSEASSNFEKTLAERDRQWEQRFNQFAQQIQPRPEPKAQPDAPDIFENPNGFLEHGVNRAIEPVNQRLARIAETFSRRMAVKEHGQEKVQAAFVALDRAASMGNRDAIEAVARVKQSDDPYGDIVDWHQKSSVISEFGANPEEAIQKRLEAALNDPAFLAKAAAKLGVKPAQQQPSSQSALPSLNNVTAAADEDGEEDDPREVFNSALRSGVRR